MSDTSYPALTQAISQSLAPYRKSQPATMQGFSAMAGAAMADGALSEKHKELIALGISGTPPRRCRPGPSSSPGPRADPKKERGPLGAPLKGSLLTPPSAQGVGR
jgi:hypothetical protein